MRSLVTRITSRLVVAVLTLFGLTLGVFWLLNSVGDPAGAIAGQNASLAEIESVRRQYGFDQPIITQYFRWLGHACQGDLGKSYQFGGQPVTTLVMAALPTTLWLIFGAIVIAVPLAILAGFISRMFSGGILDRSTQALALVGVAFPPLFLALWVSLLFGVYLRWLPPSGFSPIAGGFFPWVSHMTLPWVTLALGLTAQQARTLRASLATAMTADYVRTARAKGMSETVILLRHVGRNAVLPFITVIGLQLPRLITGAVFVEFVFGLPGVGSLIVTAVQTSDFPTVEALVLLIAVLTLLSNLIVDLLSERLNPLTRVTT